MDGIYQSQKVSLEHSTDRGIRLTLSDILYSIPYIFELIQNLALVLTFDLALLRSRSHDKGTEQHLNL